MPEYDWMKDPSFQDEVISKIQSTARAGGMKTYETAITDRLMAYLSENRELLIEQELVKTASLRRTKRDALDSVETVIKRASEIARLERRKDLRAQDFDRAYQEKFCMLWPFCGRRK